MNNKLLAVLAVVAMAFAGAVVYTELDATPAVVSNDYHPTAFAYGYNTTGTATTDYVGMKVLGYADGAILIDTNAMANLGAQTMFYVGLTANGGDAELKIGPIASQNGRIWIDAAGMDLSTTPVNLLQDEQATIVKLYPYSTDASAATTEAKGVATLTWTATDASLTLITNHSAADAGKWAYVNYEAGAGTPAAPAYDTFDAITDDLRNSNTLVMGSTLNTKFDGTAAGYGLKGWSVDWKEDSYIAIEPTATMTIEEIIFAMADNITDKGIYKTRGNAATGFVDPIAANTVSLYAIWQENVFKLQVSDITNIPGTANEDEFGINDIPVEIGGVQKAKASITSQVSSNSFALLKIEQTVADQYTYVLTPYYKTYNPSTQVTTWTADIAWPTGNPAHADIKMINNGLYKISNVDKDLRILITMTAIDDANASKTNAYAFQINEIRNDNGAASPLAGPGFVNLSLDLYDYVPDIRAYTPAVVDPAAPAVDGHTEKITIEGTYFKNAGDGQRIYGNISNLPYDATGQQWTGTYDQTEPAGASLVKSEMTLSADRMVNDLSLQLGTGIFIYAAQGVWNGYTVGETSETVVPAEQVTTPWAIYKPTAAL